MKTMAVFAGYQDLQMEFWGLDGENLEDVSAPFNDGLCVMIDMDETPDAAEALLCACGTGGNGDVVTLRVNGLVVSAHFFR